MNDAKLKRWGWGAIIGLVGVILVAGLVIAVSLSSPKPTTDSEGVQIASSKTDEKKDKKAADKKAAEEKKAAEKKAAEKKAADEKAAADKKKQEEAERQAAAASESTTTTADMPKTGPLDTTVAVLGGAVVAYLAALNFGILKKRIA